MILVFFMIFFSKISVIIGGFGGFFKCFLRMFKSVFLNFWFFLLLQCKYSVYFKDIYLIRIKIDFIKRRVLCKGLGNYLKLKVKYIKYFFIYSLYKVILE